MGISSEEPGLRRPRRDARRARNRRNLVDAALRMMAAGNSALTVAGVSRQAGIDPSGFYAHFKNLDECQGAAAEALRDYSSGHIQAYTRLREATTPAEATDAREALLSSWMSKPQWVVLLSRCRADDSPLGKATREVLAAVRQDVQENLWDRAIALGIRGRHLREVEALADMLTGLFVATLDRLSEGRGTGVRDAAERLGYANEAIVRDAFARMLSLDAQEAADPPSDPA